MERWDIIWLGLVSSIPVLFVVLLTMFVRDVRRVRRGEPIKFWFLREIHPGEPLYFIATFHILAPYFTFFSILIFFMGLITYLIFTS
jgi:hypothetical protein